MSSHVRQAPRHHGKPSGAPSSRGPAQGRSAPTRPSRSTQRPKHQTLPKLPINPLHHLGLRKQNKTGQSSKSIFLPPRHLAFHSSLPEIELNPLSYHLPSTDGDETILNKFAMYHTSHLEIDYKHSIETERNLGIPIDLNQFLLHTVFLDEKKVEKAVLSEEDNLLLHHDSGSYDSSSQRRELLNTQEPWLRRSKYMDVRDHQTTRQTITRKLESGDIGFKSQSELQQEVENTFNVIIPDEHPSKPGVVPEMVFDFIPNFEMWGLDYSKVSFDTNPLPSSTFEDKDESSRQGLLLTLGNRLYRGGLLDKNLCRENHALHDEVDFLLPPSDSLDGKPYTTEGDTEYRFIRTYTFKSVLNPEELRKQKYISASGRRHFSAGYFLCFDNDNRKASYCKIENDVQIRKKATDKQSAMDQSFLDEKPEYFVRGREFTAVEKEEIDKRKTALEADMERQLF